MSWLLVFIVALKISSTTQIQVDNQNLKNDKFTVISSKIVSQSLKSTLETEGTANIFVVMGNSTDTVLNSIHSKKFATRPDLQFTIWEALSKHAELSQKDIREFLDSRNIEHKSFWMSNEIYIENATTEIVNSLLGMSESDISSIDLEEVYPVPEPVETEVVADSDLISKNSSLLWNMNVIGLECAWKKSRGEGIIVGNIDTGVRWDHERLKTNFLHEMGWFDPRHPLDRYPSDDQGHGTHTMGTIAGAGGIGVAPGAKWMACKGCRKNGCQEHDLKMCGQYLACPFSVTFSYSSPSLTEKTCKGSCDVINNSWGGGQATTKFRRMTAAWRAAGIIPVFSQGNSGPKCGSARSPGDYADVIGVGATNSSNGIARFSSVGPSFEGLRKPDISAPGQKILSAIPTSTTSYAVYSGTSMAAPHITGIVALMISSGVCKQHIGYFGSASGFEFYNCIYRSLTSFACKNYLKVKDCNPPTDIDPNYSYIYGYGIANACASLWSDTGKCSPI